MKNKKLETMTWAVDPYSETEIQQKTFKALGALATATRARIEPVYVLSPDQLNMAPELFPGWQARYLPLARRLLGQLAERSGIPQLEPPEVLVQTQAAMRWAVDALVKHAMGKGSDAIAVSTHARRGLSRFFLGSFAETLLMHSPLPVLSINPSARVPSTYSHLMFPTDFSQPSRRGFEEAVELARQLGARLSLYSKTLVPLAMPFPEAPNLYQYAEQEVDRRKELAQAWLAWARGQGVETTVTLDDVMGEPSSGILTFASRENVDLIVIVGQSGPASTLLLGSITRQVLRGADCPVWVRHIAS